MRVLEGVPQALILCMSLVVELSCPHLIRVEAEPRQANRSVSRRVLEGEPDAQSILGA
jgi:hypothetical protein